MSIFASLLVWTVNCFLGSFEGEASGETCIMEISFSPLSIGRLCFTERAIDIYKGNK